METIFRKGPIGPNMAQKLLRLTDQVNPNDAKLFKKRFRLAGGFVATMVTNRLGALPAHTVKISSQPSAVYSKPAFVTSHLGEGCEESVWAVIGVTTKNGGGVAIFDAGTVADMYEDSGQFGRPAQWVDCNGVVHHEGKASLAQRADGVLFDSFSLQFPIGAPIATLFSLNDAGVAVQPIVFNLGSALKQYAVVVFSDTLGRVYGVRLDRAAVVSGTGEVALSGLVELDYAVDAEDVRAISAAPIDWGTDSGWWFDARGDVVLWTVARRAYYPASLAAEYPIWTGAGRCYYVISGEKYWRGTITTHLVGSPYTGLVQNPDQKYFYDLLCDGGAYSWTIDGQEVCPTMEMISQERFAQYAVPDAIYVRWEGEFNNCADPLPIFSELQVI